jgi:CBS-domain-containing membrane protein
MEASATLRGEAIGLSAVFAVIVGLALAMLALYALTTISTPAGATPANMGTTHNGPATAEPDHSSDFGFTP